MSKVMQAKAPAEAPKERLVRPRVIHYVKRKRILDILGSLLLMVLLSPLLLAIALWVKLTSKGPVIYKSTRVGLGGRHFQFLKFRSMYVDADRRQAELLAQNEKDGPIFKMKNDPRITPIGRALRRYSLDELPQLWNVFVGEMSLVGPRPPLPREVEQYTEDCLERLSVKPGITCYWQIMGRSDLSFEEWMELDKRYLREMGVWTDLKILLLTPIAVFRGDGAY
ncbi:MAG TPA: exopolysaccharide biosynthesis polyprenyl glycosylphosphotransferase [Fimbriimonadaceae bacterium]|nr:exopolysaccharide biosynthesis polyprenyl glycosylphosphotransferase [Fimbriimonadaceae bacterium]HQU18225.1 exopolysaccharide biosynthesis polyprenyl glycosylphosphotransferase [Fimbriimonadaceae bacterium]